MCDVRVRVRVRAAKTLPCNIQLLTIWNSTWNNSYSSRIVLPCSSIKHSMLVLIDLSPLVAFHSFSVWSHVADRRRGIFVPYRINRDQCRLPKHAFAFCLFIAFYNCMVLPIYSFLDEAAHFQLFSIAP